MEIGTVVMVFFGGNIILSEKVNLANLFQDYAELPNGWFVFSLFYFGNYYGAFAICPYILYFIPNFPLFS